MVLAQVLAEDRRPADEIWQEALVSSRLLEYEAWNRIHLLDLATSHGPSLDALTARIAFLELDHEILARALDPFPLPLRTLDALHLASAAFLADRGIGLQLATFDHRMAAAASTIGLELSPLAGVLGR